MSGSETENRIPLKNAQAQSGMSIDDKASKTLKDLGARTPEAIGELFAEVCSAADQEEQVFLGRAGGEESDVVHDAEALRNRWLARKNGLVSLIDENWLKPAPKDLKPVVGRLFNEFRKNVQLKFGQVLADWGQAARGLANDLRQQLPSASVDLTLPGYRRALGSIHPVTQVMREIEEIFLGLGFSIESGPEIESVYYNFDALNIPESHPARDDWDTLYVNSETVLRTHTSPVQIRAMEKHGAPLYILCPGKAYRHDNPDSTHATMFHQVEGLAVDTDISFADLKGTLDYFAKKFFGDRIRTNFSPSFFPFTEPSGELSISCVFCGGEGCRVCKESGWVEVMGCGMVHPEVLLHVGIDPERYSGWAFGLGVERFAMMKYDINDIQLFHQGDVRFLEQF
jgi:phenylalanyl-tRNA synthetase alpha chain